MTNPLAIAGIPFETIAAGIERESYFLVPGVLPTEYVDQVRTHLRQIEASEVNDDVRRVKQQRVARIVEKHQCFRDILSHPQVVAFWRHLLGNDMICSTWTANTIQPGHGDIHWHVDYPYWSFNPPFPPGFLAGQTIFLLDDFTIENGATGVIPGKHTDPFPPTLGKQWPPEARVLIAPRGSVVLAHGCWWHTSRPNHSAAPRSVLLGMFARKYMITQEDMRGQLGRIKDPTELETQLLCGHQRIPADVHPY